MAKLITLYDSTATPDWPWFEEILSYDNARIPQALIAGGRDGADPRALEIGLTSLEWLTQVQRSPRGHFRAIGCHGFYKKGGTPAWFDQQPVEANATVGASSTAGLINTSVALAAHAQGSIVFTSGADANVTATVRSVVAGTSLSLMYPLPETPSVGDAFTVYYGCDHTRGTCQARFNNLANFRGFPFVPPPQIAY